MKLILQRAVMALATLTIPGNVSEAKDITPIATTVCSVTADPRLYAGKVIAVEGQLESDGMHFTVITDPQCSNAGFAVKAPKPFVGESEFNKALQTGHPGTLDKTITGRFIGKFVWNPNRMPKRALVLIEVSDLHLTMKK